MPIYNKHVLHKSLWDLWCIASLIGIWPRFIEPRILSVTRIDFPIPQLPESLHGLKIVQLSDLHLYPGVPSSFLQRLVKKVNFLSPDLIVFTGDFLCAGQMSDSERLKTLLNSLKARYGCFAILGNHDYEGKISINSAGDYDRITDKTSTIEKGFGYLLNPITLTGKITEEARQVPLNHELLSLLQSTPFQLLHNQTVRVPIKDSYINVCGLGEYMAGKWLPDLAFKNYHHDYPGIILTHNPDTAPKLKSYPGDLIFSGHTHGGQVNLPIMWKRFTLLENMRFKKGLFKEDGKWIYVNRGLGSVMPFRWFSPPEILLAVLSKAKI